MRLDSRNFFLVISLTEAETEQKFLLFLVISLTEAETEMKFLLFLVISLTEAVSRNRNNEK